MTNIDKAYDLTLEKIEQGSEWCDAMESASDQIGLSNAEYAELIEIYDLYN